MADEVDAVEATGTSQSVGFDGEERSTVQNRNVIVDSVNFSGVAGTSSPGGFEHSRQP